MTPNKNSKRQSDSSLWRFNFGNEFVGELLFSGSFCQAILLVCGSANNAAKA